MRYAKLKRVEKDDGRVREHGPREQILPKLFGDEKADVCPLGKEARAL